MQLREIAGANCGRWSRDRDVYGKGAYSGEWAGIPSKKTMEAQILRAAVEIAREKKWIARSPLSDKDGK
jgi:hypothetical protein